MCPTNGRVVHQRIGNKEYLQPRQNPKSISVWLQGPKGESAALAGHIGSKTCSDQWGRIKCEWSQVMDWSFITVRVKDLKMGKFRNCLCPPQDRPRVKTFLCNALQHG